ncbi:MAG: hypothetical protein AAFX99_23400, partial [Myxococcota bacterium]
EDHGSGDSKVTTQIFLGGQVLDSKTVDYSHLLKGLKGEDRREKIRKVMVSAHKSLYNKLFSGEYNRALGEEALSADDSEPLAPPEEFEPSQERVPQSAAQVVEEDGKVTFTFDSGEAVDLQSLSRQLNEIDVFPPDNPSGNSTAEGHDFGDLIREVEEESTPSTRSGRAMADRPPRVTFRPTGRRAFQGLIEPQPDLSIIDQVMMFLEDNGV